jgi:hypothetical protein
MATLRLPVAVLCNRSSSLLVLAPAKSSQHSAAASCMQHAYNCVMLMQVPKTSHVHHRSLHISCTLLASLLEPLM